MAVLKPCPRGALPFLASVRHSKSRFETQRTLSQSQGKSMEIKWTATLKVEFELVDGEDERLARVILTREVGRFRVGIEQGIGLAPTCVKRGSAKVEIVSQG
jgi:hypothetical protein